MSNIKSFFLASGQFIGGFVGWLVVSLSVIFAVSLSIDLNFITPVVSLLVQLIGLGFAFLAFRGQRRWTVIGLLCALSLYLLGFFLYSCIGPGFPYPLSVFPCL